MTKLCYYLNIGKLKNRYITPNLRNTIGEKTNSLKKIALTLHSDGINDIKEEMINDKIVFLRSYYGAEKRKEKASKSSGARTSDVYTSIFKFMNELNFLNDNFISGKSFLNINVDSNPSSLHDIISTSKSGNFLQFEVLEKTGRLMELVSQKLR